LHIDESDDDDERRGSMAKVVRAGGSSITIGDELQQQVVGYLDQVAPKVTGRLRDEVDALRVDAEADWPVGKERDRVHSRELFETELVVIGDAIHARLRNPAEYLYKIKSEQNGLGGKSAFVRLIRSPARARAKQIADDLQTELVALWGR